MIGGPTAWIGRYEYSAMAALRSRVLSLKPEVRAKANAEYSGILERQRERDRKLAAGLEKSFRALEKSERWRDQCAEHFERKIGEVPMVWEQWHFVYDVPEADLVRLDAPRLAAEQDVRSKRKAVIEAMSADLCMRPYAPGDAFPDLCRAEEIMHKAKAALGSNATEAEGFRRLHTLHIAQSNVAEIARRYETKLSNPVTEIDGQIFPVTRTKGRKRKASKR